MPLNRLLESIQEHGNAEAEAAQQRVEERASELRSIAKDEVEELRQELETDARRRLDRQRAGLIQEARAQATRILGDARRGIADDVVGRVRARLSSARDRPDYDQALAGLVEEAVNLLGGERARISADPRDEALLERIRDDRQSSTRELAFDLETWGGVVVEDRDGAVSVDNRLEARLERAEPDIRESVERWLADRLDQSSSAGNQTHSR